MTLEAWLATLPANPLEPETSPSLIVVADDPSEAEDAAIAAEGYRYLPYAVVFYPSAGVDQALHDSIDVVGLTVGVTLYQNPNPRIPHPDRAIITALWRLVMQAPRYVTALEHDGMVGGSFVLVSPVPPYANPDKRGGLVAPLRFRAQFSS